MINYAAMVLFHIIGDFYLQTSKLANKKEQSVLFLALHSIVYSLPFCVMLFALPKFSWTYFMLSILISHFIIDFFICRIKVNKKQTIVLIIDQILHMVVLLVVYKAFQWNDSFYSFAELILMCIMITFTIIPPSILINKLFIDLFNSSDESSGIENPGAIIGIFERILVLIFAYTNNYAVMAIIISIKTWARTQDIKDNNKDFRQKYLLGTLCSLTFAVTTVVLIKYLIRVIA